MRVLHFEYDDERNPWVGGGGSVRVRRLYGKLVSDSNLRITVYCGNYPGAQDRRIEAVEYRYRGAPAPYWWSRLSYAWWASLRLRRNDYDVAVIGASPYTPILVPGRRDIVHMVHHLTGPTAVERWGSMLGGLVSFVETLLLRRGRRFVVPSEWTRSALRERLGVVEKVAVVANGVDPELFALERDEEDYLLWFGRVDVFQKGLDRLLEATSLLRARGIEAPLVVAGRGRDLERLRSMVRERGLDGSVHVLGPVSPSRRNALFRGALTLVMPSRFEGFGIVAAEAMAAGVPVIASDAGALPEVIRASEGGGMIVREESATAFADCVEAILASPAERRQLGERARELAGRYRWERVAERYLEVLLQARTR